MSQRENLSYEEMKAIEDLQARIGSDLTPKLEADPTVFYRFLKARDFDVVKAEKMLRRHIRWRKAHQIDTIVEDFKPKEVYRKHLEGTVIGFDKDGDVVFYSFPGKVVNKDMLRCLKMNDYMNHLIWNIEKVIAFVQDLKKVTQVSQSVGIINSDTLTLSNCTSQASREVLLALMNILQNNYPETLKSVFVINVPSYFVIVFSIVKAVMSNAMSQKFHIFGHSGWKEKLLEKIDADVLPAFLGGNRTDPDGNPLCNTFVNHGGKVNLDYTLSDEDRYFKKTDEVENIVIPQRGKKEIYVDITEITSLIRWKFLVKSNDIGFGLSLETLDHEVKEILPVERYTTSDGTEEGFYKAMSTGKYIIIFDNSYSWLSSKEIEYCLEVVKPAEVRSKCV